MKNNWLRGMTVIAIFALWAPVGAQTAKLGMPGDFALPKSHPKLKDFDVPEARRINVNAVSPKGFVAGDYSINDVDIHGFVRNPRGKITTFDVPGALELAV